MKRTGLFRRAAATLAVAGLISGQFAQAASPTTGGVVPTQASQTERAGVARDVGLLEGGVLRGQVVDSLGAAQAKTKVLISRQGTQVALGETDEKGQFQVSGLQAGLYQVETMKGGGVYRLWAPRTAPPAANAQVMIVQGDQVVRGQDGRIMSWLGNPWVLGGLCAVAIAVPLALDHNSGS